VNTPPSAALNRVLEAFGTQSGALIGQGGEASVYAIDNERVLRVLHHPGSPSTIRARQMLIDELMRAGAPFSLPGILEVIGLDGLTCAVERHLPGTSVLEELAHLEGGARVRLIEAHLEAVARLGDFHLEPRGWYGELIAEHPIRTSTWREYLETRAARSLQASSPALGGIDPTVLASDLPEPDHGAFVHLDAFASNMLVLDGEISAVLDIGYTSAVGDRRLDPLSAAVYLSSKEITGVTERRDVDVAMSWLRSAGLDDLFEPARRWLAAYWSFATDDARLQHWCQTVLAPP
jgi:hypothetical protein